MISLTEGEKPGSNPSPPSAVRPKPPKSPPVVRYTMSNDELRDAIEQTNNLLQATSEKSKAYGMWLQHLEDLLQARFFRANQMHAAGDLKVPQPTPARRRG